MTELLQFVAVILLIFIWRSIASASRGIAQSNAILNAHFEQLDERLQDIEARIKDNFMTDDERQREADMQP